MKKPAVLLVFLASLGPASAQVEPEPGNYRAEIARALQSSQEPSSRGVLVSRLFVASARYVACVRRRVAGADRMDAVAVFSDGRFSRFREPIGSECLEIEYQAFPEALNR
jgi:hypothetical protein